MTKKENLQLVAWTVSVFVFMLAIVAWGESYGWQFSRMNLYQVFPLLGLVAFSLMWGHYVMAALRRHVGLDKGSLKTYFDTTSVAVLSLILLHPGLLAWQLWRDGKGLPPVSELGYVISSARWAIILGFVSLGVFLLYELRRKFAEQRWWRFVQYASDIAMVLVFFHALKLGGALHLDWFRVIWYFYGITLLMMIGYLFTKDRQAQVKQKQ